ncbi:hypothetical protein ACJOV8_013080 [Formosa sp. 3Alg 14/1]|uniref:hypothetical protein n=1 Tax=Formosa sp. 3Alg 14/1 TaxID=3382190 RepID=UPI0039BE5EC8
MAEIKIEKKKPIWPWILVILIILGIIMYVIYTPHNEDVYPNDTNTYNSTDTIIRNNENESAYPATTTQETMVSYESSSTYLVQLQENLDGSTAIGTDSVQTRKALYNLAYATASKAEESNIYDSDALKNLESQLQKHTTSSTNDVDMTKVETLDFKTMSSDITTVIEDIQTNHAPELKEDMSKLKETSNALSTSMAWSEQQKNIEAYFKQAHDILINIQS